jgi:kynurenine formamidase
VKPPLKLVGGRPETSGAYRGSPRDWGRWGDYDEIGRANLLDPARVVAAAAEIRTGRRYSLALPICAPDGDLSLPGRTPLPTHVMTHDASHYADGREAPQAGGLQFTDDWLKLNCHGTTHMDGLGHTYADDTLWNGHAAETTVGGLRRASVAALAEKGIVGRAVLVDIARSEGAHHLEMHRVISLSDIVTALERQRTVILPGDTIILRTGIFRIFYEQGPAAFYEDFDEPGVGYSREVVDYFVEKDIAGLGTDTMSNERPHSVDLGADFPLHIFLQRNLGVIFHEALWLESWADDCAEDGRYAAFYIAAPLRLVGGSAAPMNPIVIK